MIAATYSVHGIESARWADVQKSSCVRRATKPAQLSVSRNGIVAILLDGSGERSILVWKGSGERKNVDLPNDKLLASVFTESVGRFSNGYFPSIHFKDVHLADDGTLFATIINEVSGAVVSSEYAVFQWDGRAWSYVSAENIMPLDNDGRPVGVEIAAAQTPRRLVFNGLYGRRFPPAMNGFSDPTFFNNQSEYVDGRHRYALGSGTSTGLRGGIVVGFQAELSAVETTCHNQRSTYAAEWIGGGEARSLGRGISYDVNSSNDVVGDNEKTFGMPGQPVLWSHGRTTVLDKRPGSAYAITDDRTIVGTIAGEAFIVDSRHLAAGVIRLGGRLIDRTWHVRAAYAIAPSGRIIAVGNHDGKGSQIVVLDPK